MIMVDKRSGEPLKKVVGKKKPQSVWLELYRLNTFADNLGLSPADDGYQPRKVVGKVRTR